MLILYRKNKQSGMGKEEEVGEIKQSGMENRERVKRYEHGVIAKEEGTWRSVTGVKY